MPVLEVRAAPPAAIGGRVRVEGALSVPTGGIDALWFELDAEHAPALTARADPFAVAALVLAMDAQRTLRVVGAPVSASLARNLEEFQRIWHAWYGFPIVDLDVETVDDGAPAGRPEVTAFTGGVDSAFTAWWHTRGPGTARSDVQAGLMIAGVDIPRADVDGFARAATRSRTMLDSVGLELVTVTTNIWEPQPANARYVAIGVAATLHLLAGRFGRGLVPSTVDYRNLVIPISSNPVSDARLGGSELPIDHDGAGYTRLDKVRALAEWPEACAGLRVCLQDPRRDRNCGQCAKCMLTILEFRVLGVDPTCFDRLPTDDELASWVEGVPNHPLHRCEGLAVLTEIVGRDERPAPAWVKPLRRRLQYLHAKEAVRRAVPRTAARVADAHRRIHGVRAR